MSGGGSRHGRRLWTVVFVERKRKKKNGGWQVEKLFLGFIDTLTVEETCIKY